MSNGEWNDGMSNKELILAIHERLDAFEQRLARKPDRTEIYSIVGGVVLIVGVVVQALM